MRKFFVLASVCGLMLGSAAAHAQQGAGYTGVIAPSSEPGTDAQYQSMQEQAAAAKAEEMAKINKVNEEQLKKSMEEAKQKQSELSDRATQAEHELDNKNHASSEEWTPQQNKEYQKMLSDVTRQQKELEDMARRELEAASKAGH